MRLLQPHPSDLVAQHGKVCRAHVRGRGHKVLHTRGPNHARDDGQGRRRHGLDALGEYGAALFRWRDDILRGEQGEGSGARRRRMKLRGRGGTGDSSLSSSDALIFLA